MSTLMSTLHSTLEYYRLVASKQDTTPHTQITRPAMQNAETTTQYFFCNANNRSES